MVTEKEVKHERVAGIQAQVGRGNMGHEDGPVLRGNTDDAEFDEEAGDYIGWGDVGVKGDYLACHNQTFCAYSAWFIQHQCEPVEPPR